MTQELAAHARGLVESSREGVLCTNSQLKAGFPFGSVTPYAIAADSAPLFLFSSMAMHTDNIHADPHVSLFVAQPAEEGDLLNAARVNVFGVIAEVPQSDLTDVRNRYLATHPQAEQWIDFDDFTFYRLEIDSAYYIGGFGTMGWIEAIEYNRK